MQIKKLLEIESIIGGRKIPCDMDTLNLHKSQSTGEEIKLIDRAPRANFKVTTIYFKPNVKNAAKRLGSILGGRHIIKPLTWSSGYNIIVVTIKAKKPAIND